MVVAMATVAGKQADMRALHQVKMRTASRLSWLSS